MESFFEDIFTAYDFRLLEIHPFRIAYYVENVLKLSSKINTSVNQTTAASVWRWSLINNVDYLNICIKPTFSYTNTFGAGIKGLCQLESMRAEVIRTTSICQNSIVFRLNFSVTYRAPNFTATFTSELGLDKGHFDKNDGTFLLWFPSKSSRIKVLRQ